MNWKKNNYNYKSNSICTIHKYKKTNCKYNYKNKYKFKKQNNTNPAAIEL